MTTDITELAQREKFEAWFKSSFHPDKTGPYIKDQLYFTWKAAGAELVEALEKAQQRIAELEEAEQKLCAANVTLDARAELAERQRIADLESRTVTVKLPPTIWYEHDDYAQEIAVLEKSRVLQALTAAGIKWEAE